MKSVQGDRIAVSPFASSGLPYISRPPPHPLSPNVQAGQSAPTLPATAMESRMEAKLEEQDAHPESYSAPTDGSLRKVLPALLTLHSRMMIPG